MWLNGEQIHLHGISPHIWKLNKIFLNESKRNYKENYLKILCKRIIMKTHVKS